MKISPEPQSDSGPSAGPADERADRDGVASESISRNTAFAFLGQLSTSALTAVLTLYLVRALGPSGYGVFTLALAVGGLVSIPSDLGISTSAARFIAERRGERDAAGGILADALQLKLLLSGAICIALWAAADPIASAYGAPELAWPLRGVALAGFGAGLMALFGYSFSAQGLTSLRFRLTLAESVVETGLSIALVALGTGATGAAFGRASGYLFAAVVGFVMTVRLLGRAALRRGPLFGERTRRIGRYAGVMAIADGAYVLFEEIDALLIGAFLDVASVGLFQAPLRLVNFLHYPGLSISIGVSPRLARHQRHRPNVEVFLRSLRGLIVFQALLVAPLVVWSTPIVDLVLGSKFADSADVLRALAPFAFLAGIAPLASGAISFLGEGRRRIPIAVGTVLLNLVLDVILLPRIGVVGAAIGTSVAFAFFVPGYLWICQRVLGFAVTPLVVTTVRSLLAAAAMGGVLAAFGTTSLSLAGWLAGGLAGIGAFALTIVLTGELRPAELRNGVGYLWRTLVRR